MRKVYISTFSCNRCRWQYLSKKNKDNARYKVQNISVLKFLKESASENNVMWSEIIFASFIIKHNLPIAGIEQAGRLFHGTITKKKK